MTQCGNPVAILPPPVAAPRKPGSSSQRPAPQSYIATLPDGFQVEYPTAEITYAVEVLNRNARGAGLSNRAHVPAVYTLPPPGDLSAELTGDGVVLTWTSAGELQRIPVTPPSNAPATQLRYRIYRRDEASAKEAIAGEVPFGESGPARFTDSAFAWERTYLYRITAVSIVKRTDNEVQVEGDDSRVIRVVAHDVFPPAAPTGVQAVASGEGQKPFVDLIWAPVTSADLAGYNLYRRDAQSALVKLNSELVKSPAYRDSAVVAGTAYVYSVSAVDARGNESAKSEEANEQVP